VYDRKDSFFYDEVIHFVWNSSTTPWKYSYKENYTYNFQGLEIEFLSEEWDGNNWIYVHKYEKTYKVQGKILTCNSYNYVVVPSSWINIQRDTYQYVASDTLSTEIVYYNGDPLIPSLKYTYTYDTYNNRNSHTFYVWDNGTSSRVPNSKTEYYWNVWDVNSIQDLLTFSFNLYPNPCEDPLFISVNSPIKTIDIFDVVGKKVLSQSLPPAQEITLDVSNIPSCFYQLQITNSEGNKFQKSFIKNK